MKPPSGLMRGFRDGGVGPAAVAAAEAAAAAGIWGPVDGAGVAITVEIESAIDLPHKK